MTYDHWKTTNPDDEFLGPDPEEEDDFNECDDCGELSDNLDWLDKHGKHLLCPACMRKAEQQDEAADRGDHECHQERDQ